MNSEVWMDIPGYEGKYQVSNIGQVKSVEREYFNPGIKRYCLSKERMLTPRENKRRHGYLEISLHKQNHEKRYKVHRLVALAFIPNPNNYPQVNHIDGNKKNNAVENLEWCTASHNIRHALETGLTDRQYRMQRVMCMDTGEVFESVCQAAKLLPCDRKGLFKALKAGKPIKGHTFQRISNEYFEELRGQAYDPNRNRVSEKSRKCL